MNTPRPTILIIDDNSAVRRVISYTLQKDGYPVIAAADAWEGLQQLDRARQGQTSRIHLLILDVAMPGMDGLSLLKQLRADEAYKHLPVIMLTASCDDKDLLTARAEGANEFLTKPTSSRELLEVVGQVLTKHAATL
jgi:CheY-like chemotaxis protein